MFQKLDSKRKSILLDLLEKYLVISKKASPGEWVETSFNKARDNLFSVLVNKIKQGEDLSKEEQQSIVQAIDCTVVMLADLKTYHWNPEYLDTASKLRDLYFKQYGVKVYG